MTEEPPRFRDEPGYLLAIGYAAGLAGRLMDVDWHSTSIEPGVDKFKAGAHAALSLLQTVLLEDVGYPFGDEEELTKESEDAQ